MPGRRPREPPGRALRLAGCAASGAPRGVSGPILSSMSRTETISEFPSRAGTRPCWNSTHRAALAGAWAAASSLLPSQTPPQPPWTPLSSEPLLWDKEGKEEAAEAE